MTVSRPEGLFHTVFVAPQESAATSVLFDRMIASIRFR